MRKVAIIKPLAAEYGGPEVAHLFETLDLGWGCFSYGRPVPTFKKAHYVSPSEGWSHDHCEFCWANFFEADDEGKGTLGWIIDDPGSDYPMKLESDDPQNTKTTSSPWNIRNWACLNCKATISKWQAGELKIEVDGFKEIPGREDPFTDLK
ncbi:hypothetical protein [uncultured Litoreibacter sp.]|uniref:hypothetical protein n=1 Tax=uncultured Litoreibacter sp. TaxID=1392394 RepID=UPI002636C126|nr:hypothetical protein [uncultured Litoreibacter sp.]